MDSTWGIVSILLAGVFIVVGSILVLRLHAFLALILAAFTVAVLTPAAALERYFIQQASFAVLETDPESGSVLLQAGPGDGLRIGMEYRLLALDAETRRYAPVVDLRIEEFIPGEREGEEWTRARYDADVPVPETRLRAVHALSHRTAVQDAGQTIGVRVARGFGGTATQIGILIAMAAIIGKCLLDSGAADRIVRTMLRWFGERAAPGAFLSSGFLLSIPVFFDTVFYLMIPLGKAMRLRTGRNYLLYVLTIVCGGTMAHSLVPPTPGPLIVAEELGVDLGTMILVGGVIGFVCALCGYVYATIVNRYNELPLRESADFSLEELEKSMQVDESQLPPFWLALLPILLPVLLISGQTILNHEAFPYQPGETAGKAIATLGDKNIALVLSAAIAMVMLISQKRTTLQELSKAVQAALASGGVIILITSAGGAFGQTLRQTGVADLIRDLPQSSPAVICTLAFLVTTAVRTAQGSSTVAMITAAGILSGLARDANLGFHPVYLAAAIGCGSKPLAWMNDSGFWVITRMSGMTEAEGLKYITPLSACMGAVGLVVIVVGVTLFPTL